MSQNYGIESPGAHHHTEHQPPARYLIVIDAGGNTVARLFLASREQVAEFDAGAEEVGAMVNGLMPAKVAAAPEWDRALEGHSMAERRAADVYTLDL